MIIQLLIWSSLKEIIQIDLINTETMKLFFSE